MADDYWIVREGVGIKCFPRAGSTTILHTYGYGQSRERWMAAERRYVVVREPWERLLSAYALLFHEQYTNVPKPYRLDDLLDYIIYTPTEETDSHVRSQHAQLEGYEPTDAELITMEAFFRDRPVETDKDKLNLHKRQTTKHPVQGFSHGRYKWWRQINAMDFELYDRAKK